MRIQITSITGATLVIAVLSCSSDEKPSGSTAAASASTDGSSSVGTTDGSGGTQGSTSAATTAATTGATTTSSGGSGTTDGATSSDAATTTTVAAGGSGGMVTTDGTAGTGGTTGTPGAYNCDPAPAGSEVPALALETVADGFDEPLYVSAAPGDDTRLFVVEQDGSIHVIENGTTLDTPFLDVESQVSRTDNERGMFGIAFHPNYQQNGLFYVHYSASQGTHGLGNGDTVVSEFSVSDDPNVADAGSERVILTESQPDWNHNGGMLAFGPDGYLYIGLGDGGGGGDAYDNGQNLGSILAAIIRIDVDDTSSGEYGIPAGNMTGNGVAPELWDYGLRNPWRFSFDACTGDLYIADVGQNDYEEVNVEPAGSGNRNYGWSITEGLGCYNANSCEMGELTAPVLEYGRGDGTSITGGYVYRGSAIPELRGAYFYADFGSNNVWTFRWDAGQISDEQTLTSDLELPGGNGNGVTSFGQDNSGEIYIVQRGGAIHKIVAE